MATAKIAGNPTQNLFSLLADDAPEPTAVASAPKVKKDAPKKPAAAAEKDASSSAALTPAEKAKLREAKPKAPKPAQQERAPRRDQGQGDERASGPRGTGNRGARRAVNAESHGHQAPNRGRAFDRHSGAIISRKPPPKKGGAGKGNWGDSVKDSVVDQETAAAVSGWNDSAKPAVEGENKEKVEEDTAAEEPVAPAEPEEVQLSLDDYLKQKEEAAKALAAKVGAIQPRKLDNIDLTGAQESRKADASSSPATAQKQAADAANARKGTKSLDIGEVFKVRVAPVGGDREDRPRGRGGRGGRGRGRGGDRPEGERRPPRDGDAPRGARGGNRGGRGEPRGESRGESRGGRGGRGGKPLDTTNNRQFPSLGQ